MKKPFPKKVWGLHEHLIGGCGQLGVQLHRQRLQEQEEEEEGEKEEEEVELEQVQEIAKVQAKQIKAAVAALPQNQSWKEWKKLLEQKHKRIYTLPISHPEFKF